MPEKRCPCGVTENVAPPPPGEQSYLHTCGCGAPYWVTAERVVYVGPGAVPPEQQAIQDEFEALLEAAKARKKTITWKLPTTHLAIIVQQLGIALSHPRNCGPMAEEARRMQEDLVVILEKLAPGFRVWFEKIHALEPEEQEALPEEIQAVGEACLLNDAIAGTGKLLVPDKRLILP